MTGNKRMTDQPHNNDNNPTPQRVVINLNPNLANLDDATIPNMPVQNVPIIDTPRPSTPAAPTVAPTTPQAIKRLTMMEKSNDGFSLAELRNDTITELVKLGCEVIDVNGLNDLGAEEHE